MPTLAAIRRDLRRQADPEKANILRGFFKTEKGEYGEGDIFLGLVVPKIRALAGQYKDIQLEDIAELVGSPIHEERLLGLLILVSQFERGGSGVREKVFRFYLANTRFINNWDLVDLSADKIVGTFLAGRDASVLYSLAKSDLLWERRIAIMATFHFIKNGSARHTLAIAKMLIHDEHDLIHKAVGWMLREIGKRVSVGAEERFLRIHCRTMPRTMLRYAIERFPEKKRQKYLKGYAGGC